MCAIDVVPTLEHMLLRQQIVTVVVNAQKTAWQVLVRQVFVVKSELEQVGFYHALIVAGIASVLIQRVAAVVVVERLSDVESDQPIRCQTVLEH